MKKDYKAPKAEVVKFQYKDQVVAQSVNCGATQKQARATQGDCCDDWSVNPNHA